MKYETPELNVVEFETVDVIQTSGDNMGGGENELPFDPASAESNLASIELDSKY